MKSMKITTIVSLVLLSAMLLLFASNNAPVKAQSSGSAVIMHDTIGGTTSPAAGTIDTSGNTILTATPDPGFEFAYWIYLGPDFSGHGIAGVDGNTYSDNPLSIYCAAGYTVEFQAVFLPTGSAYLPSSGVSMGVVISAVAIVAVLVGAGAFIAGRRLRK